MTQYTPVQTFSLTWSLLAITHSPCTRISHAELRGAFKQFSPLSKKEMLLKNVCNEMKKKLFF